MELCYPLGVVAVAVVVEVGFGVVVLRREAVREDGRHRAGLVDGVPEGVVGELGDEVAVLVPVPDDVAVVVVAGEVVVAVDADGDKAADAARARPQARLRHRLYGASLWKMFCLGRKRFDRRRLIVCPTKSH